MRSMASSILDHEYSRQRRRSSGVEKCQPRDRKGYLDLVIASFPQVNRNLAASRPLRHVTALMSLCTTLPPP